MVQTALTVQLGRKDLKEYPEQTELMVLTEQLDPQGLTVLTVQSDLRDQQEQTELMVQMVRTALKDHKEYKDQ